MTEEQWNIRARKEIQEMRSRLAEALEALSKPKCDFDAEWSGDELYPTDCYACSVCGFKEMNGKPRYCPGCGARVIE